MLHPSKARVTRELVRLSRSSGGFDASRYFRSSGKLGFYNVGTARVRALAREIYRANRERWSLDDAMRLADSLVTDRYLETKGVGIEVVALYRRALAPEYLPRWKRWLAKSYSNNWATTDAICGMLIGPLVLAHPKLAATVAGWSRDRHLWVRRASAVALIPSVRRGLSLDLAYRVAARLRSDPEDLIQKAVGWMLREAGNADPVRLERYLRANGPKVPRTTVRYAIERFSERKRRAILTATRTLNTRRSAPRT